MIMPNFWKINQYMHIILIFLMHRTTKNGIGSLKSKGLVIFDKKGNEKKNQSGIPRQWQENGN